MSEADRRRWDDRYGAGGALDPAPPAAWPSGRVADGAGSAALDVACGAGAVSVWLALAGYDVTGIDVSPAAIERATALADAHGVAARCRFAVVDLDDGLATALGPLGAGAGSFGAVVCQRFRMPSIYPELVESLAPGGVLAITVLSVVGHVGEAGPFRAAPGELRQAFSPLLTIDADHESGGEAHLFGCR